MRAACDKVGVKARKVLEKERADAEKKRERRQRDEGDAAGGVAKKKAKKARKDPPGLIDSGAEESEGEEDDGTGDEEPPHNDDAMDVVSQPAPPPPPPPSSQPLSPPGSPHLMLRASQEAEMVGSQALSMIQVSQEAPTRLRIQMPSRMPPTPPPAPAKKKRVLGEADRILALASQLEQIEASQPPVEDLRAAEANPATWQHYLLEMLALESKFVETEYESLRKEPAKARKIFQGGVLPVEWPQCYSFLRKADASHYRDHLLLPYYSVLPDNVRGDVPKDEMAALMLTDEQIVGQYHAAWTMAAALARADIDSPHFRHPRSYYPGDWADNSDDAIREIGRVLPSLLRGGAPAPIAFPETSYAVRVRPPFLFPELLLDQPLPFPPRSPADISDYTSTLETLVRHDPHGFGNLRRESTGELDADAVFQGTLDLVMSAGHDIQAAQQAAHAMVEPARQARMEEDRRNVAFLTKWAGHREKHIKEQLMALAKEHKSGRYPGLLYPDRSGNIERAMVPTPAPRFPRAPRMRHVTQSFIALT
jgi:hypothetical protein